MRLCAGQVVSRLVLCAALSAPLIACGKGDPAAPAATAPSVDTLDRAALKDGESSTRTLKFWMKNRGLVGDDIVDNLHFDDGANTRIVFTFAPALAERVGTLEQGKPYKVTFTFKASDDALLFGELTGIE